MPKALFLVTFWHKNLSPSPLQLAAPTESVPIIEILAGNGNEPFSSSARARRLCLVLTCAR